MAFSSTCFDLLQVLSRFFKKNPILKTGNEKVDFSPYVVARFDLFYFIFDERNDLNYNVIANNIIRMRRSNDEAIKQDFFKAQL